MITLVRKIFLQSAQFQSSVKIDVQDYVGEMIIVHTSLRIVDIFFCLLILTPLANNNISRKDGAFSKYRAPATLLWKITLNQPHMGLTTMASNENFSWWKKCDFHEICFSSFHKSHSAITLKHAKRCSEWKKKY